MVTAATRITEIFWRRQKVWWGAGLAGAQIRERCTCHASPDIKYGLIKSLWL